jgi:hypothetical protein
MSTGKQSQKIKDPMGNKSTSNLLVAGTSIKVASESPKPTKPKGATRIVHFIVANKFK